MFCTRISQLSFVEGLNNFNLIYLNVFITFYLIILCTNIGLQIVFNLDEVSFVQNLVFYIESAYCVPVCLHMTIIN